MTADIRADLHSLQFSLICESPHSRISGGPTSANVNIRRSNMEIGRIMDDMINQLFVLENERNRDHCTFMISNEFFNFRSNISEYL
jgi:hypothetical protein